MQNYNISNITIRDVEVVTANLTGKNFTVVKLLTSEPELYGLGCASFAYRNRAVELYVKDYILPLIQGRCVDDIEDLWHLMSTNSYWRNGPVGNNAISGIDMALWDIKGKIAGLPLYSLLGGKSRQAVGVYRHADGDTLSEVLENIDRHKAEGYSHFRIQLGVYGGKPRDLVIPPNSFFGDYFSPEQYINDTIQLFDDVRSKVGFDIQLLHDSHERLTPVQALFFAKELEKYRLFFLEDILPPEQADWYKIIRQQVSTPMAVGETFSNPKEWEYLIANRLIDFIRMHISALGGVTPARKLAIFAEQFGIRTAWHAPSHVSPVGQAVNVHLGLNAHNTGLQEWTKPLDSPLWQEAFPGMPETRNGYIYVSDKPGIGVEMNMDVIKKHPEKHHVTTYTQNRYVDGTICMP